MLAAAKASQNSAGIDDVKRPTIACHPRTRLNKVLMPRMAPAKPLKYPDYVPFMHFGFELR